MTEIDRRKLLTGLALTLVTLNGALTRTAAPPMADGNAIIKELLDEHLLTIGGGKMRFLMVYGYDAYGEPMQEEISFRE